MFNAIKRIHRRLDKVTSVMSYLDVRFERTEESTYPRLPTPLLYPALLPVSGEPRTSRCMSSRHFRRVWCTVDLDLMLAAPPPPLYLPPYCVTQPK
jgi:hypothetical protein